MTASTVNADETFTVRGTEWTITQDHTTGFWSVSSSIPAGSEECDGLFLTRARMKYAIQRFGR